MARGLLRLLLRRGPLSVRVLAWSLLGRRAMGVPRRDVRGPSRSELERDEEARRGG